MYFSDIFYLVLLHIHHVVANIEISFYFYGCVVFGHIYYIFFIHSPVDGQLSCFHILAILNSASMNVGMHVPFQTQICKCFCVFGYIYSGIELLGHMIVLYHINNLKYADDITLMAESKQELKSLYVRVKEES